MKIEIDQSGKIEDTSRLTVLAFSNNKNGVVLILAIDKKILQNFFRRINKPRIFTYLSFSVLVYILIKNHISNGCSIIIDREYPGYEKFISEKLREFIQDNTKIKDFRIYTYEITRKSNAHSLAWKAYNQRDKRNIRKIKAQDIIKIIEKNLKSGST